MQSNLAIAEELLRISAYLEPTLPKCPDENCKPSSEPNSKQPTRFGKNRHGTPRYKCIGCGKIFTFGGKSTKRQRETHVNRDVFRHLVNTVPIRGIIKLLGISTSVLYDRIDFIHEQCRLFAGERDVIDDGDEPSLNSRTPAKGMLLHEQSVMHAHV